MNNLPPLSIYVHIPWCIKKCPYCDFNSHEFKNELSDITYIKHLVNDLKQDLPLIQDREIKTIFIGGGTPSIISNLAINLLIDNLQKILNISNYAEITIETNPGTVDSTKYHTYKQIGINRISLGVQTLNKKHLKNIGRIHGTQEIKNAIESIKKTGLYNFNIDLMYGLPNQSLLEALDDLSTVINWNPPHISWYQLTIEPNTSFYACPPQLPHEDTLWNIFVQGKSLLKKSGYSNYEISTYAKKNYYCKHNLNYWRFGDYIGIGCGAYGKITQLDGTIIRTIKTPNPYNFMQGLYLYKKYLVKKKELPLEYFMNRFRLLEPIPRKEFTKYTNISANNIRPQINNAISAGYIKENQKFWQITKRGSLFLNELIELFIN